jgi:hypothetical protein
VPPGGDGAIVDSFGEGEGGSAAPDATATANVVSSHQLLIGKDGPSVSENDVDDEVEPGSISETAATCIDVERPRAADEPSSSSSSTSVLRTLPQSPPPSEEEEAEIEELRRLIKIEQRLLEEEQQRIDQVRLCVL